MKDETDWPTVIGSWLAIALLAGLCGYLLSEVNRLNNVCESMQIQVRQMKEPTR